LGEDLVFEEKEIDMSERQLSVTLGNIFRSRLRREADKRGLSVSQLVRALLTEGIERIDGVYVTVDRDILETILAMIFGIEEMVVRGFVANVLPKITDEKERIRVLESIDPNAMKKAKDLLDRAKIVVRSDKKNIGARRAN
jgi:hypothetical protein